MSKQNNKRSWTQRLFIKLFAKEGTVKQIIWATIKLFIISFIVDFVITSTLMIVFATGAIGIGAFELVRSLMLIAIGTLFSYLSAKGAITLANEMKNK